MMLCRNCKPMIITGDCLCDGCNKPPDECPRITEGDCGPCVKDWIEATPEDDPDDEDLTKGE